MLLITGPGVTIWSNDFASVSSAVRTLGTSSSAAVTLADHGNYSEASRTPWKLEKDSVALEGGFVTLTQEEGALLCPSQKKLHRDWCQKFLRAWYFLEESWKIIIWKVGIKKWEENLRWGLVFPWLVSSSVVQGTLSPQPAEEVELPAHEICPINWDTWSICEY